MSTIRESQHMLEKIKCREVRIGLIGLGYVGLPLAVEFGKQFHTTGFDVKEERLANLRKGIDNTLETSAEDLKAAKLLRFTGNPADLAECDLFIVTVPTPVDKYNRPDLAPLRRASATVGKVMKRGAIVIYESTVYPGCTEEECVPILAGESNLVFNRDFFCGYSPERINPGDKEHTLTQILKITSGSTPEAAETVDALYNAILKAGTYKASCIKVAEAAKVIENSQRDLNIAFVNELAKIFHLAGIDTGEVLAAAGTKWNFLKFKPGLVGGHCIGVDPYYLTQKATELGYLPEVILAGRRINDGMGKYVAEQVVKLMISKQQIVWKAKVLILGLTFKENCPDVRNSRVVDVVRTLQEYNCDVDLFDPWADPAEIEREYQLKQLRSFEELKNNRYAAVVLAVAHREFNTLDVAGLLADEKAVVYDIKGILPPGLADGRL